MTRPPAQPPAEPGAPPVPPPARTPAACAPVAPGPKTRLKLRQAQVWKRGDTYLRIVRVERLEVEFKATPTPTGSKGRHHTLSKKEFCRLLKDATLLPSVGPGDATLLPDETGDRFGIRPAVVRRPGPGPRDRDGR